jgi:two-component system, sensor histidine kinase and response regulator
MSDRPQPRGKPIVLIVEDSPDDIAVLNGILREQYHVRVATGGEAALAIATGGDSPPDLILLDIMMPDMDGLEVCRRLKQDAAARKIPVIFVTARDAVADESLGFAVGAVDYITKPVNPYLVKARVKAHLELKQAREDLERQNETLQQNARLREEVEAISRHDLKNPLMIIMNVPRLLLKGTHLSESEKKLLGMVEAAGRQMLDLINRTIDLFRMETGSYELNPAPVDAARAIEQILAAFHDLLEKKQLAVDATVRGRPLSPGEVFLVMGEELLVYFALANLVKNAIEASPRSGRISVSVDEGDAATIAIRNTGAIPHRIRDRFFQKFATADKEGGTGLGAYSARLMVRTMGGEIQLAVSDKEETTLIVTLPRA